MVGSENADGLGSKIGQLMKIQKKVQNQLYWLENTRGLKTTKQTKPRLVAQGVMA